MKMIKMALLGGAALAVTSAGAYADELTDLKAQIEALNNRMAAMEAAPAVPAGYSLLTVSKGEQIVVPGLDRSNKQIANEGNSATIISVLPTADAPAGTEIAWSGYARAGLVYVDYDGEDHDLDVYARGQIKVVRQDRHRSRRSRRDDQPPRQPRRQPQPPLRRHHEPFHLQRRRVHRRGMGLVGNDPRADAWWRFHGFARQHRLRL